MLEPFGVTGSEETLYRALLTAGDATPTALAESVGQSPALTGRRLRALEAKGLVVRTRGRSVRFRAAPPDLAIEVLALDQQQRIERARSAAAEFAALRSGGARSRGVPLMVVRGPEANTRRYLQAQLAAREEVLILDKPPYLADGVEPQYDLQLELMARGVTYRTVYDSRSLEEPGQFERVERLARAGERARVVNGVPLKMLITDRSSGLLPLGSGDPREGDSREGDPRDGGLREGGLREGGLRESVALEPSPLLDGLLALFESLWAQGTPLWSSPREAGLDTVGRRMLGYAIAGCTDAAIARRTGLSKRTVERRMRALMDALGARTRFQAGLQASRRGLAE
ncbi:winged helix-turn-helix transcriptional regulator [Kitasatospora purpeofusca]|uniref:winged helix-turn-helix transcriptional regulator n=1 Tax=Kitasatospora purpeofusca TaxID=67352 RepID=UPI0030F2494E